MEKLLETEQLTLALVGVVGLVWIVWKLINRNGSRSGEKGSIFPSGSYDQYEGPERRRGVRELAMKFEGMQALAQENRDGIRAIHARLDHLETQHRTGDSQTARELGTLTKAIEVLENLVVGKWNTRGGNTPPDGTKPPDA